MTKTFDLTPNELAAALVLVRDCLDAMGGSRPADLENDELTWTSASVLMAAGWSAAEANGTFGALMAKGMIDDMGVNIINGKKKQEWALSTAGWRHLDTVWDAHTTFSTATPVVAPEPTPVATPAPTARLINVRCGCCGFFAKQRESDLLAGRRLVCPDDGETLRTKAERKAV